MHDATPDFVVQIHSALAVRYGRRWLAMWAGLDMELVRADWRRVLRDYAGNPSAVMHALDNLPEQVPTAVDFRTLCAAGPRPAYAPLPLPATSEAGKAVMRELLARLRAPDAAPPKAWADAIADRVARGEHVSLAAREAAASVRARRSAAGDPE
ncbi:hypothetical protein [Acidovorax sp. ACV01]|uniref:hypothetical protein n=1 Tax=Acidovorax sp. ACV01 TaxID=2769311 RepID=UPI0017849286|nr:hypothetical protein [Acidovorax sp. ACV01]MBD9395150.1 hypothetical protein [Acidovorax sp. ACV01]